MSEATVYTVKQFNELVNVVLSESLGEVTVKGEISGYQVRQGKWVSFDLKDADSVINCFTSVYQLDFPLNDGQEVFVTGSPRIYVPYGKFSFSVRHVELRGEGALKKAFEELKKKLDTEGLFSPIHKRPLPRFPEKIGIITSGEGAAINDILKVVNGRWGGLQLFLYPVLVQGKNAPDELVQGLNYFNQHHPVDVILFGRGGGSLEDLQAFNSERVARAIFASRIPIVAGIGHEHNTSIADLVADVRAATPSNAAEMAVPDRREVQRHIHLIQHKTEQIVLQKITFARNTIGHSTKNLQLFISSRVHDIRMLIHTFHQRINDKIKLIEHQSTELGLMSQKLSMAMENKLEKSQQKLQALQKLLDALNPTAILKRGYSITYSASTGKPITGLADLPSDGKIRTQVSDGSFDSSTIPTVSQGSLFS